MSLRDFLLDYAENAPRAERLDLSDGALRFSRDCHALTEPPEDLEACPLEVASGMTYFGAAIRRYFGEWNDGGIGDLIVDAADGAVDRPELRAWRAVLEKLAEPEVQP